MAAEKEALEAVAMQLAEERDSAVAEVRRSTHRCRAAMSCGAPCYAVLGRV